MDPFIYRECRATITARIPDTADADLYPDRVLVQGRGTAHPQFQGGSVVFPEIGEYAIPQPVPVVIVDGELLVEVLAGDESVETQPLYLPVTVDERANQNWSWRLTFDFLTLGEYGEEVKHPPLSFPVEAGDGPLEISTVATPAIKTAGFVTRGAPGPGLQEITAENGELVFQWDNGKTASVPVPDAVEGPPGPMVDVTAGTVEVGATPTDFGVSVTGDGATRQINVMLPKPEKGDTGAPGADGEGATDSEMAARIANPATQTRATLDGAFVGSDSVRRLTTTSDADYTPSAGEAVFYTRPPNTFFTDFTTDPVGQTPAGWTPEWGGLRSWVVADRPYGSGGKVLHCTGASTGATGLRNSTMTHMHRASVQGEIAYRFRTTGGVGGVHAARHADGEDQSKTAIRGQFLAYGGEHGSMFVLRTTFEGAAGMNIGQTSPTTPVGVPVTPTPDVWWNIVWRWSGIWNWAKIWQAGTPEPSAWGISGHTGLFSDPGWVGLATQDWGAHYLDWIGMRSGPGPAPRGPM